MRDHDNCRRLDLEVHINDLQARKLQEYLFSNTSSSGNIVSGYVHLHCSKLCASHPWDIAIE